jgi:hypothetical protein
LTIDTSQKQPRLARRSIIGAAGTLLFSLMAITGAAPAGAAPTPAVLSAPLSASDPLSEFKSKLNTEYVKDHRLVIMVQGDSYTESADASSISNGYVAKLQQQLRYYYPSGAEGGIGYIAARHQMKTPANQAWSFTGKVVTGSKQGWGRRSVPLAGAGVGSYKAKFTSADVAWFAPTKGAAIQVRVDGRPWAKLVAKEAGEQTWNTGQFVGTKEHTIQLRSAIGQPALEGAWFFNGDETKGVHVIEGGNSGGMAYQYSKADGGIDSDEGWVNSIPRFEPDLIVYEYLVNDMLHRDEEQVETDNKELLKVTRTLYDGPVLFAPPYERSSAPIPNTSWTGYLDAIERAAESDPLGSSRLFRISNYMPKMAGIGTDDPNGWMGTSGHPTDKGYFRMAELYTAALRGYVK